MVPQSVIAIVETVLPLRLQQNTFAYAFVTSNEGDVQVGAVDTFHRTSASVRNVTAHDLDSKTPNNDGVVPKLVADCGGQGCGKWRFLRERAKFFLMNLLASPIDDFSKFVEQPSLFFGQIRHLNVLRIGLGWIQVPVAQFIRRSNHDMD
ncbi:hypothetical protein CV770_02350 [Bradyrhizobium sp. AC87j1]|uniref:hypothetical protein n=1 Tax=Bradyrhizobium sp. AC87j1 TaxID=2055894 RepID=UPI000CEBD697|nr:hypothetical protein [Bradyrhizobium sp. AC87j1]PPQ21097.1 hypothetical protein CV770_02350 [Bradyrhizobium sp. AC87j1]